MALALVLGLLALNLATIAFPAVYLTLGAAASAVASLVTGRPGALRGTPTPNTDLETKRARSQALTADLDAERARGRSLTVELDAARVRQRSLAADLDVERSARTATQADLDLVRRQSDEAVAAIDGLSAGILRRASRGAIRAPTVLLTSAIPAAGTAVDLAGTVLDLTEACEMADDMTALRAEMGLPATGDEGVICAAVSYLPSIDELTSPPDATICTEIVEGTGLGAEACVPLAPDGTTPEPDETGSAVEFPEPG